MSYKCIGCAIVSLNNNLPYCSFCSDGDKPGTDVQEREKFIAETLRKYHEGEDNALEYYQNLYGEMFDSTKENDLSFVYRYAGAEYDTLNNKAN